MTSALKGLFGEHAHHFTGNGWLEIEYKSLNLQQIVIWVKDFLWPRPPSRAVVEPGLSEKFLTYRFVFPLIKEEKIVDLSPLRLAESFLQPPGRFIIPMEAKKWL
jgi:hypothetical protein